MTTSGFIALLVFVFVIWKGLKTVTNVKQVSQLIKDGAVIVDVRSAEEFASGHSQGAINIPLDQLQGRVSELDPDKTIIVCCLSGGRSAGAAGVLKQAGFNNVVNAGPWQNTRT
jgi:rhodanese-related sulfurtransferase